MADKLYCGAGKAKITPPEHLIPFMFGLMGAKYGKVHDNLFVRALCFECGGKKALIVSFDLDKAPFPEEWMGKINEETGIPTENILFLGIHTHTAPLTGYRPFEGPNFIERKPPEVQAAVKEYEAMVFEGMMEAVRASQALQPARFGYGRGQCYINVNRCQEYRVRDENGQVHPAMGIGADGSGTVDRTLFVMRVENAGTGAPMAFLVNYAVHCVAVFQNDCGDGTSYISGDIGGTTSQNLEREYPGAVSVWTSAPAGDINPVQMIQTIYPDYVTGEAVEHHIKGEDAANATLLAMAGRHLADIKSVLERVECTIDEAPIKTAIQLAVTKSSKNAFTAAEPDYSDDYTIRTHLVKIGPLAFIGIDGELYTSLGHAIQEASPVEDTLVLNHDASLLLNNPGYIVDDATLSRCMKCASGGGIPGARIYTKPGTVKEALINATKALFLE